LAVVRKSAFAKLSDVSKGLVSQWISKGYLNGKGVVGEGRFAMIDVDIARAQLRARLSANERCGLNGLNSKLEPTAGQGGGGPDHTRKAAAGAVRAVRSQSRTSTMSRTCATEVRASAPRALGR
jgi:hypothetical protein